MWSMSRFLFFLIIKGLKLEPEECYLCDRCDRNSDSGGVTRLASVRCPVGLAFDIDRQTCDWKTNVKNCDQIESK